MAKKPTPSFAEQFAESYLQWEDHLAPQLADLSGPPESAEHFTNEEELDLWDWLDPKVNPDEQWPKLLAEAQAQGVPVEHQQVWAHAMLANLLYPNRVPIMTTGIPDLEAQIEKANSMTMRSLNRRMKRLADFEMPSDEMEGA